MSEIKVKASCVVAEYNLSNGKPELVLIDGKQVVVGKMEIAKQRQVEQEANQRQSITAMDVESNMHVEVVNNISKEEVTIDNKEKEEPEDEMLQW